MKNFAAGGGDLFGAIAETLVAHPRHEIHILLLDVCRKVGAAHAKSLRHVVKR